MEIKKKELMIRFSKINNQIQTQMHLKGIAPQEAIGLLEMAKDQILDDLKKGRKDIFRISKKGDDEIEK